MGFQLVHRRTRVACLAAALLMAASEGSFAQAPIRPSDAEICLAANQNLALGASLPRTAARLKAGDRVRIIAIGSSSTSGLWVMGSAATYPEVMRRELAELRPNARIEVISSGRLGETIAGTMARFERDVLAHTARAGRVAARHQRCGLGRARRRPQGSGPQGRPHAEAKAAPTSSSWTCNTRRRCSPRRNIDHAGDHRRGGTARACRSVFTLCAHAPLDRSGAAVRRSGVVGRAAQFRCRL